MAEHYKHMPFQNICFLTEFSFTEAVDVNLTEDMNLFISKHVKLNYGIINIGARNNSLLPQ
jgi:hypothetical protein